VKHKRTLVALLAVILVIYLGMEFWRGSADAARRIQNNFLFRSLSAGIELYREDMGSYPKSLSDVQLNRQMDQKWHDSMQIALDLAHSNVWHDVYDYKPSTNGFTISVSGSDMAPAGWLGRQRKFEKFYRIDEALNWSNNPFYSK